MRSKAHLYYHGTLILTKINNAVEVSKTILMIIIVMPLSNGNVMPLSNVVVNQ